MSSFVIGDVHGCHDELCRLLQDISYSPSRDKLLLTGDLVGRGPQSLAVLRTVKELQEKHPVVVVLGNHDLHFIALALGSTAARRHHDPSLSALLRAADCSLLLDWLRRQPLAHHEEEYDSLLVHAGIPPLWELRQTLGYAAELEEQLRRPQQELAAAIGSLYGDYPSAWDEELNGLPRLRLICNYLTRMRLCTKQGELLLGWTEVAQKRARNEYRAWFHFPRAAKCTIIFGHWAALKGATQRKDCIALDYGCVWGGRLAALRLEDRKIFTTKGRPQPLRSVAQ